MNSEDLRARLRRRAIRMQIGGFRPPDSPGGSWFGRVDLALPGEAWPTTGGLPMLPLCQINLTELPFRPQRLDDLAMIAVFIGPEDLPPDDTPNGDGWCLRAYPDLSRLVPLASPAPSPIRAFPMRPEVIEEDFPMWEDVPEEVGEPADDYYDLFPNQGGLKLGGWPTLVQGVIWPFGDAPASPEYVFQVDTVEKAGWTWGDGGVGYFGRGTAPGRTGEWAINWQCY